MIRKKSKPAQVNGSLTRRITEHLTANGIPSLEAFADACGIGRVTLYSLVQGGELPGGGWVDPSLGTLVTLAGVLKVPLHVLVYELEPEAYGAALLNTLPRPTDETSLN